MPDSGKLYVVVNVGKIVGGIQIPDDTLTVMLITEPETECEIPVM
jgi:hypothetical protein